MIRTRLLSTAAFVVLLGTTVVLSAPDVAPPPRPKVVLTGYRTVKDAIRANPKDFKSSVGNVAAGYLGLLLAETDNKPIVEAVAPGSPAERAGLREGDTLIKIDDTPLTSLVEARDILRGTLAGDSLVFTLSRSGKTIAVKATLDPVTKPLNTAAGRAILGITLGAATKDGGVKLDAITSGGPADRAGLKAGDVILKADGKEIAGPDGFRSVLGNKTPGDRLELIVLRGEERLEKSPVMEAEERAPGRGGIVGWDDRVPSAWRKPTYKLAIVGIEYPDVKHNDKIQDSDWEKSMFSKGTYTGRSPTGDKVYGSMSDYFKELSYGTFEVEGKFVGWVEVSKKRMEYSSGSGTSTKEKTSLLTESLDLFTKKNGKDSLNEYDGFFFLYAGSRVQTTRGGLYWPHCANVSYGCRRLPYFIVQEGGSRMNDISVFCHEFGHMLGLPDLYARPEQPGSEGVGVWCAMSNQIGGGRPQHFSAWSKEQLGWVKPVVIDPRVKQKLILAPINDDPTQCYKVMVRPDGSEYFLLEYRRKVGWDSQLPAEGLLIWRVTNNRPLLEESHGVEGARGPGTRTDIVPFPSSSNTAFTPYTMPSSRSQLGGGLPVWITNIQKQPDGRITFHIGYEYQ